MTRARARMAALLLLAALGPSACERRGAPVGQLVIHVATDAPLPPPPGTPLREDEPSPLFDRASFEILPPGRDTPCDGCANDFAIDRDMVASGRASIGALYSPGRAGYRARVRVYRSSFRERFGPRGGSTLEAVVALPALAAEGITDVAVTLRVDELGAPRGSLTSPEPATIGVPAPLATWPKAAAIPCATAAPEGMACVPGGAFWMGDPSLVTLGDFGLEGTEERIVVLSPFFVELHEATVAELRASGLARRDGAGRFVDPVERDPQQHADCTFTHDVDTLEQRPANCLTFALAEAFCSARGRRLPSEAELEYMLGGLRSRPWVWGFDPPSCEDAVAERNAEARDDGVSCIGAGVALEDVGHGRRDRLPLAGGAVVDLAGSVSELALDAFSLAGEGFWKRGVFVDPRADVVGQHPLGAHALRGGNFFQQRGLMRSAIRQFFVDGDQDDAVGFRCAQDAR